MTRDQYRQLERLALSAHASRSPSLAVSTGELIDLLAAVQDMEAIRRLCGEAATWVGVEPVSDVGHESVARVRRQLREVRKGAL